MERSFREIIFEKEAKGSLHDLKKCYTESDPELFNHLELSDPTTQFKLTLIINQYNQMVNVYLKNHDEFRLIQAQIYTIIAGLLAAATTMITWFCNNYSLYALGGLVFVCIFSWILRDPLVCSIHKNRLFHETTALYIRAIEDKLGLYNIPLRSKELVPGFWYAFERRSNYGNFRSITGEKWIKGINFIFWLLPCLITIIVIVSLGTLLSQFQ